MLRLMVRRRRRALRQSAAYRRWREANEPCGCRIPPSKTPAELPGFSMLLVSDGRSPRGSVRAVVAASRQRYSHWELWIAGHGESLARLRSSLPTPVRLDDRLKFVEVATDTDADAAANVALANATGRFVLRLEPDGELSPGALACFAAAVDRQPDATILYADHDRIDWRGRRCQPSFNGNFDHTLLLTGVDLSHAVVCDRRLAAGIGGWRSGFAGASGQDFVLRAVVGIERRRIVHVPCVLNHRRVRGTCEAARVAASRRAVSDHLARLGVTGAVETAPEASSRHRVRYALPPDPPLVTIIICTRDNSALLGRCLKTLREQTRYPAYEILVVDNGSCEAATRDLLASWSRAPDVIVVRDDAPFNFSGLNNAAVASARGDVICLLNDDTEILTPTWLEEMVGLALLDDVGTVGARLWYPDATLQHGGVVLDPEIIASHAFARYPRGDSGYADRAVVQQERAAVSAACLVVRRRVFLDAGGLDERLAVAFNDVDFCLRLRGAGLRTIWTPYAELIHHESVSRGRDTDPAKRRRLEQERAIMRDRWGEMLARDPCYGPNFSSRWADFTIDSA